MNKITIDKAGFDIALSHGERLSIECVRLLIEIQRLKASIQTCEQSAEAGAYIDFLDGARKQLSEALDNLDIHLLRLHKDK